MADEKMIKPVEVELVIKVLRTVTMTADTSDPDWEQKVCDRAAAEAWRLVDGNVISAEGEVVA